MSRQFHNVILMLLPKFGIFCLYGRFSVISIIFGKEILFEFLKRLSVNKIPNTRNTYSRAYFNWAAPKGRYLYILVEIRNQKTNKASLVIGIEAKVNAPELHRQVVDYQDAIAGAYKNSHKFIIFLSPLEMRECVTGEKNHKCFLLNTSFIILFN